VSKSFLSSTATRFEGDDCWATACAGRHRKRRPPFRMKGRS